ncbi:acetoacetate decarboxylase [Aspergillus steynii IBT 23096]|uniref:Acetoacetate decarboxylase n=1 Tax=Aspergillus steynii IBT 23096 TaxID=1392250 RepID=A0A2I2GES0_9EURO|nr:acetoacetate decarboxylase [Aspergillus steynii IBT 23096]PLB51379.1 acetoacetate decarboxylase [Aspergillus steynii IBT 23096]
MPFGSLPVDGTPIPQYAPPYSTQGNEYSDMTMLIVTYRTKADNVRPLVPDVLELEDEPLVTAMLLSHGMSTFGTYQEYVHAVEVTYNGERFDYNLSLILENEAAIFCGREQLGYPKKFGPVSLMLETGSRVIQGQAEYPAGQKVVQFNYSPIRRLKEVTFPAKRSLNLRVIPSAIPDQPSSVKELIPFAVDFVSDEAWEGSASISFPEPSDFHPMHRVGVLRYESAILVRRGTCAIHAATEVFPL